MGWMIFAMVLFLSYAFGAGSAEDAVEGLVLSTRPILVSMDQIEDHQGTLVLQQPSERHPGASGWVWEAENAKIGFATGGGFVPTSTGGIAIQQVEQLQFALEVPKAGQYTVWALARYPTEAHWSHAEELGGRKTGITDSEQIGKDQWGQWIWIQGGTFSLDPGETTLLMNWLGGAELDRIVIANASLSKEEVANLPTTMPKIINGQATSSWITPRYFAEWKNLFEDLPPFPGVQYEVSTRDHPEWRTMTPQIADALRHAEFRLRISLTASPSNPVPVAPLPDLYYHPSKEGLFTIQTSHGQAVFSKATGNLLMITNAKNKVVYNGQSNPYLLSMDVYPGDTRHDLSHYQVTPGTARFHAQDNKGIWDFKLGKDFSAQMQAEPGEDGSIQLSMTVNNISKQSLGLKTFFPRLRGILSGPGVTLLYPLHTGMGVNHIGSHPFQVEIAYPLDMASQWVTVTEDQQGGLAFGAWDQEMREASYRLAVKDANAPLEALRFFGMRLAPGESRQLPAFNLFPFDGDWHVGAAPYRNWLLTKTPVVPPTPYLDHAQGFYLGAFLDMGDYSYMPWYLDLSRKLGIRLTHWFGQAADLAGACPVQPLAASPAMGGAEVFRAMNLQATASGLTTGYYFNTQLYTRHSTLGSQWLNAQPMSQIEPALQKPPFMLTKELESDLEIRPLNGSYAYCFWVIMPTTRPEWRELQAAWTHHYLETYAANHIYFDQFSVSDNDWIANMPDQSIAALAEGHKELAKVLRQTAANTPGRHYFPNEGYGELALRELGYGLWASTTPADEDPGGYQLGSKSFQAPGYGHFLIPWGNWYEYLPAPLWRDRMGVYNAVLNNVLNVGGAVGPKMPAEIVFQPRQVRESFNMLWSGAWYQDTLGIVDLPPGMNGRTCQGNPQIGKFEFAILTMEDPHESEPQAGELVLQPQTLKKVASVWLFAKDQSQPLPFKSENGRIHVQLPAVRVAYVLMVEELPDMLRLNHLPWEAEPGSSLQVQGTWFRWTKQQAAQTPQHATLILNGEKQIVEIPAGPGESATPCEIEISLPNTFDADHLVEISQELPHHHPHVLGYVSAVPPARAKMYASYAKQTLTLYLENPTATPQVYQIALTLPSPLQWKTPPPSEARVEPGKTQEIIMHLNGMRDLGDMAEPLWIKGSVTPNGSQPIPVFASVQTPLYDTSFEHAIGENGKYGFSIFWHRPLPVSIPADIPLSYCGMYIDSERSHSGKQSLRFDPDRDAPTATIQSLMGRGEVGHKYRLSAWFYREHPEDTLNVQLASASVGGAVMLNPTPEDPVGKWFKLEVETPILTKEDPLLDAPFGRFHTNIISSEKLHKSIWIDDVTVELIE